MRFLSRFWGPKTESKSSQCRKTHSKIDIDIELRFFIDFRSPRVSKMEAPNPTFPSKIVCFAIWERKPAFLTRNGFRIDVGAHLAPFWHHFWRKMGENRIKSSPSPLQKTIGFLIDLLLDF